MKFIETKKSKYVAAENNCNPLHLLCMHSQAFIEQYYMPATVQGPKSTVINTDLFLTTDVMVND